MIEKGVLNGKREGDRELVANDEALARVMRLGVEGFVYDQQGYSFVVVRAPIERVAEVLKERPGVMKYVESAQPIKMRDGVELEQEQNIRHCFLVQMRDTPEWSVLIQTVHWFHSCDAVMVTAFASVLSDKLRTLAAAGWDDDFSGSSLIVCENGKQQAVISDGDEDEEDGWVEFYEFFYDQGIQIPSLYVGVENEKAILYADDPAKVTRADYVLMKVPTPIESQGPHVFEKFGMMAEAAFEELEDESAFMEHMRGGVWAQAQAVLAADEV
jgi:hypothetical protein